MQWLTWARTAACAVGVAVLVACGGDSGVKWLSIGGTIQGLKGSVVLALDRASDVDLLSRDASGGFTFSKKIVEYGRYTVTVQTQPEGQICSVNNGSGVFTPYDVSNIEVTCADAGWQMAHFAGSTTGNSGSWMTNVEGLSSGVLLNAPFGAIYSALDNVLWVLDEATPPTPPVTGRQNEILLMTLTGLRSIFRPYNSTLDLELAVGPSSIHTNRFYYTQGTQILYGDSFKMGSVLSTTAQLKGPRGMAVDSGDTLYISDATDHVIKKVDPTGAVSVLAGSAGNSGLTDGKGTAARFNKPWGLALDASGNLYVADKWNNAIRKVTPDGTVTTLAGNGSYGSSDGTGAAARFGYPEGVAVDGSGSVYVADTSNNLIRMINAKGEVSTLAGQAGNDGAGLINGRALQSKLNAPASLSVDKNGNIYIADRGTNTIRKLFYAAYTN